MVSTRKKIIRIIALLLFLGISFIPIKVQLFQYSFLPPETLPLCFVIFLILFFNFGIHFIAFVVIFAFILFIIIFFECLRNGKNGKKDVHRINTIGGNAEMSDTDSR
jgi:hypothetical protein